MIERSPRAPVLRSMALRAMAPSASSASVEIDRLHLEQPLILLHQRVLGLGENELEGGLVEILERSNDRQSADEFGDQAILQEVWLWEAFPGADSALSPASVGYPDACDGRDSDARLRINGTMRALLGALRECTRAGVCDPHADNLGRSAAGHYPLDLRGREFGTDHVG
jgi:hypothetical protein